MGYNFNLAKIDIFSRIYKVYHWKVINNFEHIIVTTNKKKHPTRSANFINFSTLLLQEASFEHNAATIDFAIHLLGVIRKADALNLCTTLDDH